MLLFVKRSAYRVAHPLLSGWLAITRLQRRGAKCVVLCEDEVLLVRHTYGDRRRWDLPGGVVGRRESPQGAAARELAEEVGVRGAALRALGARELSIHGRRDEVHYFCCVVTARSVTVDPVELSEAAWFGLDALPAPLGRQVASVISQAKGGRIDGQTSGESAVD